MSSYQNAYAGEVPCPDPAAHNSKLQGRQSKSSMYSSQSQANPLGPDGKLSAASAAQSLKYAQPHTLPSYPSHGLEMNASGASLSQSAGKAALLASKDGGKVDVWHPGYSAPGHHAASIAMGKSGKLGPQLDYGYTDEGRSKALLAATTSISRGVSGVKSVSRASNANVNRSASTAAEGARVPSMKREMFTEHPPIALEVEEKRKADALRAASTIMAKAIYENQKKQGIANSGAQVNAGIDQYPGLHDLATKLAAERLAKLDGDGVYAYREHYGTATAPNQYNNRMSMKYRSFRASMAGQDVEEDDSDDEAQANRIRYQMSHFNDRLKGIDMKKRTTDRNNVLTLAQERVQARLTAMDEKVFADTGKVPPAMQKEWEAKAQEKASADMQATQDKRMLTHGKVHLGGGKYMDQSEIDAIALIRMQPTLDEITATAEKQRARDEEIKRDMEERRVKDEEEKQRLRAEKAEQKRIRDEEKNRERNARDAEKLKKSEEKAQLKAEERARRNQEKLERDARMQSLKEDRDAREQQQRSDLAQPKTTTLEAPTTTPGVTQPIKPTRTGAAGLDDEESPHTRTLDRTTTTDDEDEFVEVPSTPTADVHAVGTTAIAESDDPNASIIAQRALEAPLEGEETNSTNKFSMPSTATAADPVSSVHGEMKQGRAEVDPRVDGPSRFVASTPAKTSALSKSTSFTDATTTGNIADSSTVITPTASSNAASATVRSRRESRLSKFMSRLKNGPSREMKSTPSGPTPQDPLERIGASSSATAGATSSHGFGTTSDSRYVTATGSREDLTTVSDDVTPSQGTSTAGKSITHETQSATMTNEPAVNDTIAEPTSVTSIPTRAAETRTIGSSHSGLSDSTAQGGASSEHTAAILARVMGAPAENVGGATTNNSGVPDDDGSRLATIHGNSHAAGSGGSVTRAVPLSTTQHSEGLYDEPDAPDMIHRRRSHSESVSSMSSDAPTQRGRTGRSEVSDDEFLEARDRFDNASSASFVRDGESGSKFQEDL